MDNVIQFVAQFLVKSGIVWEFSVLEVVHLKPEHIVIHAMDSKQAEHSLTKS